MDKKRKTIDVKACNSCESLQPDLEIQIEGRCFKLNKVLTAGILHFYRAKLNMFQNKSEVLNGINLSIEMFDEFLHTVKDYYKHKNSLWTTENLLALWDAVRIFQNPFLIINCETKVGEIISEENFETIYTKANHYKSDIVLYKARKYLHEFSWKKETDQLSLTRILTFNDFLYLLKEDSFIFEMQDKVLKSIFDWVENRDNQHPYSGVSSDEIDKLSVTTRENGHDNRNSCKEYTKLEDKSSLLSRLLKALKINSVNVECLEEMSRHHLCEQDHEAKDVITKAISFKQDKSTHGFWPPDVHEGDILNYQHIGVLADKDRVSFVNLGNSNYRWHRLTRCPLHSQITNNELYVVSSADFESLIFVLRNKEWKYVLDIPNKDFRVVSKGKFIY
uniref:BTB domain-containing protein n=1 Tax=Biomphalaria glabrata TaxID=6526 RepID=A0A2C9L7T2_BIOGL